MLCLGAIALNIFIQRCVSESEFAFFIMFTLAILIPNGILCLKNKSKKSNEGAEPDAQKSRAG